MVFWVFTISNGTKDKPTPSLANSCHPSEKRTKKANMKFMFPGITLQLKAFVQRLFHTIIRMRHTSWQLCTRKVLCRVKYAWVLVQESVDTKASLRITKMTSIKMSWQGLYMQPHTFSIHERNAQSLSMGKIHSLNRQRFNKIQ